MASSPVLCSVAPFLHEQDRGSAPLQLWVQAVFFSLPAHSALGVVTAPDTNLRGRLSTQNPSRSWGETGFNSPLCTTNAQNTPANQGHCFQTMCKCQPSVPAVPWLCPMQLTGAKGTKLMCLYCQGSID